MLLKKAMDVRLAMTGPGQTTAATALWRMIRFAMAVRERSGPLDRYETNDPNHKGPERRAEGVRNGTAKARNAA
jgi:hypothetical protein